VKLLDRRLQFEIRGRVKVKMTLEKDGSIVEQGYKVLGTSDRILVFVPIEVRKQSHASEK
jgi:hypothetical protein